MEELAQAAGVGVDTVRYYQGQGLLFPPRREGRVAVYDDDHIERLKEIRDLASRGFTLAQIRDLQGQNAGRLLEELAGADAPDPSLDRKMLAEKADVPEFIIDIVTAAGLLTPVDHPEGERYAPAPSTCSLRPSRW